MNKKKIIITISSVFVIIMALAGVHLIDTKYQIDHAEKIVELAMDEVEVFEEITLKDVIQSMNGTLVKNKKIDTTTIGIQEITFEYITDKNLQVPYTIHINVVDKTAPIISEPGIYSVNVSTTTKKDLEHSFFCGDNYDNHPTCTLEGEFNLDEVGDYAAVLKGEDSSGNTKEHSFTLRVKEPSPTKNNSSTIEESYTDFQEIIENYKTEGTKIGIDISHWQGDIDFQQVKKSGVEFAYIRVGRGNGIGEEFVLDDKFETNIKGFNKVGIPVGVYFYSYANKKEDAIKEAKWVLSKIKKYQVDLEVVFDWENWSNFQDFDLSFYNLTETAKAFTSTVEEKGYTGMVYSSKNYLENIWFPIKSHVWLAHYTRNTNYEGTYQVWQLCNDGKVEGIPDNYVDIDIMYQS